MWLVVLLVSIAVVAVSLVGFVVLTRGSDRRESLEPGRISTLERPSASSTVDVIAVDPPETIDRPGETIDRDEIAESVSVAETALDERPRLRDRLGKARTAFSGAFASIRGRSKIDGSVWDELEEALLRADVGIGPTTELLEAVRTRVTADSVDDTEELLEIVKAEMLRRLDGPVSMPITADRPNIWLFVGVNGVGKTTTIGKLGRRLTDDGHSIVMAAGDTFRAAAAEQLGEWADRCGAAFVRGAEGGDPSSVIFDGVAHGAAIGADVVLCDTAGRLHTKSNLMEELSKVRRVADKGAGTVTEVLLVLDATTGQNGLVQARQFTEAVELTGVVLTKLDGSAKGGIVFAIASELKIPVKLVGVGETAADLVDFDAHEFVDALFAHD